MFGRVGIQAPAKGWLAAGYPTRKDLLIDIEKRETRAFPTPMFRLAQKCCSSPEPKTAQ
jgi:hypothetical protein